MQPRRAARRYLRVRRYSASRLPEVRGRACAQAASASYASCRSDSIYIYMSVAKPHIGCTNIKLCRSGYTQCQQWAASPLPNPVLSAAATAYEPRTRAASAPGRQPPVRRRGRGASPGAGRGHRPPNPAAQGPSWPPPDHIQPSPAPHWTQGANGGQYRRLWPL